MKVIFLKDVQGIARARDVVDVNTGYARNYLIPKGMVAEASPGNMAKLEQELKATEKRRSKKVADARDLKNRMKDISITITAQSGQEDKLFGAVTQEDIVSEIQKESGIELNRHQVLLEQPIKKLGIYKIPIRLCEEVTGEIKVWIVSENEQDARE